MLMVMASDSRGNPDIHVSFNHIVIGNNDLSPTFSDGTHVGTQTVGFTPITRTFIIRNLGTTNLTLNAPVFSGNGAGDFSDEFGGGRPLDLTRIEIQWRTNLYDEAATAWETLDTGFFDTNGVIRYDHRIGPSLQGLRRFYRVIER